jgi:tetratricopeptide (TPR) repeat protein
MIARSHLLKRCSGLLLTSLHCALIAAGLQLAVPASLWCQAVENNGVVYGKVTDSYGHPQRLRIQLLGPGDMLVGEIYSDAEGSYSFRSLPNGQYCVVVEQQGYRPARQPVLLDKLNPRAQAYITLESASAAPKFTTSVVTGSESSQRVDAGKPARNFSPKAVQEFEKGNQKQKDGNFESAMSHYQKALRTEPDFYPALNNLGVLYERQKDHAQAETALLRSLQINADDAEAYINLGHVLYEEGKYQPAIERLQEGLKRSPQSPMGHFFLGSAYLKLGDLASAEPNLKQACAVDPAGMPSAHLQLANLYLKEHEMAAASTELQAYLRANPSDPQAPAIRKMLASIAVSATSQ